MSNFLIAFFVVIYCLAVILEAFNAADLRRVKRRMASMQQDVGDAGRLARAAFDEIRPLREWKEKGENEALAKRLQAVKDHDRTIRPRNWRDTIKAIEEHNHDAERQGR